MAFEAVTGIEAWHCILGIMILGTVYTVLGGARAVIWTDVAQFAVFIFAFIVKRLAELSEFCIQQAPRLRLLFNHYPAC